MTIVTNVEEKIRALLESTNREGMAYLIGDLMKDGFFEAPASTRFHGSHKGGLAEHSLAVYDLLNEAVSGLKLDDTSAGQKPLPITRETLIITALLHDVCKIGAYVRTKADDGWTNNKAKDKGHATLSIERITKHIKLTELEEMMIRYHMGVYHSIEFDPKAGEYHLLNQNPEASREDRYGKSLRNAWYHNPICKIMYFCDEMATLEEKAK